MFFVYFIRLSQVIEAALKGLKRFIENKLPEFPPLFEAQRDRSVHLMSQSLSICISGIVRQLSAKITQLLLHPNKWIVNAAESLIHAIDQVKCKVYNIECHSKLPT